MKDLQEAMREKGIKDVTHLFQNSFANTGKHTAGSMCPFVFRLLQPLHAWS